MELATKFTSIHFKSKELSENEKNNIHGKKIFSIRTLLSIIRYLDIEDMNEKDKIIRAINDCYCGH